MTQDAMFKQMSAWAQYRALLRNVPQQEGFPTEVVWPEKPTFI